MSDNRSVLMLADLSDRDAAYLWDVIQRLRSFVRMLDDDLVAEQETVGRLEEILRPLVEPDFAGVGNEFITCDYCERDLSRRRSSHKPDCPISLGRAALDQAAAKETIP